MFIEINDFCNRHDVDLLVVTKTRSVEAIHAIYEQGHRMFGENRVQEMVEKHEEMPKDIQWHMIGHLQSNKVKYIASFVKMIHSGSSLSLLKEINKRARQQDRKIDVLLQLKIAKEETKYGWDKDELIKKLDEGRMQTLEHINYRGVMGMATFTSDESIVHSEFANLKSIFDYLKSNYFKDQESFDSISMGMSGDYKIAIQEGATMVRIGSLLFE